MKEMKSIVQFFEIDYLKLKNCTVEEINYAWGKYVIIKIIVVCL